MQTYTGRCHCGAVEFEATTDLERLVKCDCSMCSKKNALMARVKKEDLKILRGEDNLTLYQFNTMTAKHYFCKTCGIYPFHQTRVDPSYYTVNVTCLEDVDIEGIPVVNFDGKSLS